MPERQEIVPEILKITPGLCEITAEICPIFVIADIERSTSFFVFAIFLRAPVIILIWVAIS